MRINKKRTQTASGILHIRCIIGVLFACVIIAIFLFGFKGKPTAWWKFNTNGEIYSINAQNNILYFPNSSGKLYALDKNTGKIIWQYTTDHAIYSYPIFWKNSVIVTSYDGILISIDKKNGRELWRFNNPNKFSFRQPVVDKNGIYISDRNGELFVLRADTGILRWRFASKIKRLTSELVTHVSRENTVAVTRTKTFFTGSDGSLYALHTQTGKLIWSHDTGGDIITSPVILGQAIVISNIRGSFLALNKNNGKVLWRQNIQGTESHVVCTIPLTVIDILMQVSLFYPESLLRSVIFALQQKTGYFSLNTTAQGIISLYNVKTGKRIWETTQKWPLSGCALQHGPMVFYTQDKSLHALDFLTGNRTWTYEDQDNALTQPTIYSHTYFFPPYFTPFSLISFFHKPVTVYTANKSGRILAFSVNGKKYWQTDTFSLINAFPFIDRAFAYFSAPDGSIMKLRRYNGEPPIPKKPARITQSIEKNGRTDILELTVRSDETYYENPWKDVRIYATFTNSKNVSHIIDGFYYDKDTWKLRFNAPLKGEWKWKLTLNAPGNEAVFTGSYTSTTETQNVRMKISKDNPRRFTLDDRFIFNGIGIGDSIIDRNRDGNPLNDWYIRELQDVKVSSSSSGIGNVAPHIMPLQNYLHAYAAQGGFNIYRWSVNNWSFNLWKNFTTNTRFLATEGKYGDQLVSALANNGFQIWMTMFGFDIPYGYDNPNPSEINALKQYIHYIVARYGAYISIWEISNEAYAPESVIRMIVKELQSADHENRPISISHIRPEINDISIIAPHWYETEDLSESDIRTVYEKGSYEKYGKPVVFAEQGDYKTDTTGKSGVRMRIRSWTAFFSEAILIFWNQSIARNLNIEKYSNANQYIGDEERTAIRSLQKFTEGINIHAVRSWMWPNNPDVRAFGLTSPDGELGYFYHFSNQDQTTNVTVEIGSKYPAKIQWYDPKTGTTISETTINPETTTLYSPEFAVDLALKIIYQK